MNIGVAYRGRRSMKRASKSKKKQLPDASSIGRLIGRQVKSAPHPDLLGKPTLESEQGLFSIISGSPIPAFVIDKRHRVVFWNHALEKLTNIPASDIIGTRQHWRAFYASERPCLADLLIEGSLERLPEWYAGKFSQSPLLKEAYEAIDFFPDLEGGGRWLRFTAAVIKDARNHLVGVIETLEDITERKIAEDKLLQAPRKAGIKSQGKDEGTGEGQPGRFGRSFRRGTMPKRR